MALLSEWLFELKERERWSWDRIALEINRSQGGKKGITGPTLYRYAHGLSQPRNEMLRQYVLEGLERLSGRSELTRLEGSGQQSEQVEQVREQNRAHYQFLYLNSPAMMHSMDREGRLTNINQCWLERMGYEWHEVIGHKLSEFIAPESRELLSEAFFEKLFKSGLCNDVVVQLVRGNGIILEATLTARVLHEEWREMDAALTVMTDITGQKRESLELRLWQSLIENAPDIILTVNQTGMILSINRTQPGFRKDEVIGTLIYEYADGAYHDQMRQGLEQVFRTGEPARFELRGAGPYHEPAWYESLIGPIRRDGRVIAASIITTDITERKKTEERYRTLFEENIAGVFRATLDGRILDCNEALARILGFRSPAEILKLRAADLYFDPTERERYVKALQAHGSVHNYEIRQRRKDGTAVWLLASSSLTDDEHGQPTIILGTILNITEMKVLKEKLVQQNQYLHALHETALGIISHLNLDELLEALVSRAGALLGTSHGYICTTEPGRREMIFKVAVGALRPFVGQKLSPGRGVGGRILQTGRPLAIRDYTVWPDRVENKELAELHAVVGVPLKSGQRVTGVLALAHLNAEREFGQEEIAVLQQFAELASIALDNALLYEQTQHELARRTEWASDLQQRVGETLTALKIGLERLAKTSGSQALESSVQELLENVQGAQKLLRSLTTKPSADQ